jgi:hypothetical protein
MVDKYGIIKIFKTLMYRVLPALLMCLTLLSCFGPPSSREIAVREYNYCMSGDIAKAAFPDDDRIQDCYDTQFHGYGHLSKNQINSAGMEGCFLNFSNTRDIDFCVMVINRVCTSYNCYNNTTFLSNDEMTYQNPSMLIDSINLELSSRCNQPGGYHGYGGEDETAKYCDLAGLMYGAVLKKHNTHVLNEKATKTQLKKAIYYLNKSCLGGYVPMTSGSISPCRYLDILHVNYNIRVVATAVDTLHKKNKPLKRAEEDVEKIQADQMLQQENARSQAAIDESKQRLQAIIHSIPNVIRNETDIIRVGKEAQSDARSISSRHSLQNGVPENRVNITPFNQESTKNQSSQAVGSVDNNKKIIEMQNVLAQCQDMTAFTSITSHRLVGPGHCSGENALTISNNSSETLNCHFKFSDNTGGESVVRPGQTIGGEGVGMSECNAPGPIHVICLSNNQEGRLLQGQCKVKF